jgi:flagellin
MALIINHNMMAMTAANNLNLAYGSMATSTQRLSSGMRINGAADDAAGLAIRELMRSDISSINQGVRNANDAVSMLQTADGALGITDTILIRMKELATQAATGTYTSDQRLIIDSEYQAMASEITRIANATQFNGIYLLNGNLSSNTINESGLNSQGKVCIHFGIGNNSAEDYYFINIGNATASSFGLGVGACTSVSQYTTVNGLSSQASGTLNSINGTNVFSLLTTNEKNLFYSNASATSWTSSVSGQEFYSLLDKNGQIHMLKTSNGSFVHDTYLTPPGSSISTQALAEEALTAINAAIVSKDKIRASLGATENRLADTVQNLTIQAQNEQASESQISDVDVATEMTNFVRAQILTQSAVAMLSQANSIPKMALQLIQS